MILLLSSIALIAAGTFLLGYALGGEHEQRRAIKQRGRQELGPPQHQPPQHHGAASNSRPGAPPQGPPFFGQGPSGPPTR